MVKSSFPGREHLPVSWEMVVESLSLFRDEHTWIVDSLDAPSWVVDHKSRNVWYWSDMFRRKIAVYNLYALKLKDMFQGIEYAVLQNSIYLLSLLLRSLIETTASIWWLHSFIDKRMEEMKIQKLNSEIVQDEELERELIRITHGSRFNWSAYLKGEFEQAVNDPENVPENWKQRNAVTRIKGISKDKRYSSFYFIYCLLCEFVHPNFGSNLIYVRQENLTATGVEIVFGKPCSREDTISFLEPLTGVMISCCEITRDSLLKENQTFREVGLWCGKNLMEFSS